MNFGSFREEFQIEVFTWGTERVLCFDDTIYNFDEPVIIN